eukprot:TRINITY_DN8518_c1_g1_i1.p1 TRINITY_DN8518_c1_g1~~TRINITY_DN8518_c1_g1_i1.p1  ORF type:complete len:258 (+),score=48.05 TRINITY_DN8518_c1_g1_i1:806-1579(+)
MAVHTHTRLSEWTWKVLENDRDQLPLIYVIACEDKCVVIDTGCGFGNLRQYIGDHINTTALPYLVICTHCHFDHIGGNHLFDEVAFGDVDRACTLDYQNTSLWKQFFANPVKDFTVTRWLPDGGRIYFDDRNPEDRRSLEILHTPGHCPDSVCIYSHWEGRLFVGDLIYSRAMIFLNIPGANCQAYLQSVLKVQRFVREHQKQHNGKIKMSCGHVDHDADAETFVDAVVESIEALRQHGPGARTPFRLDVPAEPKWE